MYIAAMIFPTDMKHVPNVLTIARIAVTPLLLFLLFSDTFTGYVWALILFVFAAISDYFDGVLARKYGVGTSFGKYLDPLADKILVLGTFIALIFILPDLVPVWAVALIAIRDIAVTILRSWLIRQGRELHTSSAAKIKTTVQLTYLILTLTLLAASRLPGAIGEFIMSVLALDVMYWLLVGVTVVTVMTGVMYFSGLNKEVNEGGS